MKRSTTSAPIRPGFTLVELLVSMALTLFLMTILVEAFGAGMDTFQGLRALGDVQDQLRSGLNLLKADLAHDHFEGSRHLSDVNFWDEPRREGFFRVEQKSLPTKEGTDLDGVNPSYRATDHVLQFSVRHRGNGRQNFFFDTDGKSLNTGLNRLSASNQLGESVYGTDPLGSLTSQWGEVAYVLFPTSKIPDSGIQLHNFCRAAVLTIPYADDLNNKNINANKYLRISRNNYGNPPPMMQFLAPNDFAKGPLFRTVTYDTSKAIASTNENAAVALVCSNVVSFQVRIMKSGGSGFEDLPVVNGIPEPFDSAIRPQSGYRLIGLQIVLRVYDPSSGLTRQATLNQDL
jgi:prepilin-type N-terminal cleavage/methylation domain-containing protein